MSALPHVPGRAPDALLRILTAAVSGLTHARTPPDVYEGVCRALGEHGLIAVILARHGGRFAPLTHRLGDMPVSRPLTATELERETAGAVAHPPGAHPLCAVLSDSVVAALPSVSAPLPDTPDLPAAVISLFATGLGPEHLPAFEAFAALLGATVARAEGERRLRELNVRLEQRVRVRTEELTSLYDLSSALGGAATDREAVRLTAAAAARSLPCDVAVAVLCVDHRHTFIVAARGAMAPRLLGALTDRLDTILDHRSGGAHARCTNAPLEHVEHPAARGGIALDGGPESLVEAPIIAGGRVVGLAALANLRATTYTPDQLRLLSTIANQLGAAAERLTGARSAERERLTALMEGLADGVVLLDGEGRTLACNTSGSELLEALGAPVPGEAPEVVRALIGDVLAGGSPATSELITPGERPRQLTAVATRILDVTGAPAVALTLHDTTDETLMRERLFQSEKMASVGQLVSGVAHELNNPLTGILGFAQLLMARNLSPEAQRQAETIYGEAERAARIVQNLLSFARRRRPEKTEVDVNVLITRVLELREYELRVNDIQVHRDLTEPLPPVLADPHQVQQVLLNVIANAEQAVRAAHRPGRIEISTDATDGFVRLIVGDNGPGIPPEYLRRVFDPFFTTKPVGEGTGLGLTISYGIVEEHGGRIDVESRPGAGATFIIALPAAESVRGSAGTAEEQSTAAASERRAILVIDDEPAIRNLLMGLLSLDGHQVEAVRTGAEALELVSRHHFDAVITDIRMPEMDGVEFYNRILEHDPALARRIIFTSGDIVSRDTRAFVDSASVPFLAKPFKIDQVREMVRSIVEADDA